MKMIYDVEDKPKGGALIVFALQQMLAIMAATIAVPMIIGNGLTPAAAMFGAGVGTLVYVLFTRAKSPVFLGSSFAFLGSMASAFSGAATMNLGMLGLVIGSVGAGLVYVIIAAVIHKVGVGWIDRLMPPAVIGPTVAVIGLSLAGNAVGDLQNSDVVVLSHTNYAAIVCGLITLFVTILCSTYGKKMIRLIPFVIGILAGYASAALCTVIGKAADIDALKIVDFSIFKNTLLPDGHFGLKSIVSVPDMVFKHAVKGFSDFSGSYLVTVLVAFVPVAFVVFAEHVADHKNLSSVIERDLLRDPGLERTLLGDGIGSMAGAFFGGCPNTTYGESVGCVAITRNASVRTIITAALGAILFSFVTPFVAFIDSIPSCVMGGVCIALYGFIAVSGLKMLANVDLNKNRNLFTVSVILVSGIGGLALKFGKVEVTEVATALILGILTNLLLSGEKEDGESPE